MIKKLLYLLYIGVLVPVTAFAQINTDRVMTIGKNALYFEDYVLSIQYFNQVINAKPYLADPYFYRGLAKMNLDDYPGAERDCSEALERNPFVVNAYQVRGISRIRQKNYGNSPNACSDRRNQRPDGKRDEVHHKNIYICASQFRTSLFRLILRRDQFPRMMQFRMFQQRKVLHRILHQCVDFRSAPARF